MMKSLKLAFVACAVAAALMAPIAVALASSPAVDCFGGTPVKDINGNVFQACNANAMRVAQVPQNQMSPVNVPVQAAWDAATKVTVHSGDDGGGIIHLSAFGWLAPYIDSLVQGLIALGFAILGKSKYSQWLDQSARDALETFLKNRASSLIADGAVKVENKTVKVDSLFLARAAAESATAIPGALKRFGLTPDAVAAKIIDAIPQTSAGATIVAAAHADTTLTSRVVIGGTMSGSPLTGQTVPKQSGITADGKPL